MASGFEGFEHQAALLNSRFQVSGIMHLGVLFLGRDPWIVGL